MATSATALWHKPEILAVRILFVHCNYPAQFRHLSQHLAADSLTTKLFFFAKTRNGLRIDSPNLKLLVINLDANKKVSSAILTYDAMKLLFFMDKQLFERHFDYNRTALNLI